MLKVVVFNVASAMPVDFEELHDRGSGDELNTYVFDEFWRALRG